MHEISIIVPVYNTEQYLPCCVDSILDQSFSDFELLLIDDGSTDGSGKICDTYAEKDNRVRVFHKENGGVSSARNLGLQHVRGQYVVFVDADDWVKEQFLEHLMCSDSDLVVGGFQSFGLQETSIVPIEQKEKTIESLVFNDFLYGYVWAKRFRYSLICEHGISFQQNLFYCEDICFVLNYLGYINKLLDIPFADYQYGPLDVDGDREKKYKMSALQMVDHIECFNACFDRLKVSGSNSVFRNKINRMFIKKFIAYLQECDNVREYRVNAVVFRSQKWAKDILRLLEGKREKRIGYGAYYCPVVFYYLEKLAVLYRKINKRFSSLAGVGWLIALCLCW